MTTQITTRWQGPGLSIYLLWVVVCALAELVGIAMGAVWWVMIDRIDPEPITWAAKWIALGLKSLSGLGEGFILGALQCLMLRRIYPQLPVWKWILLTVALAVAGWAAGSAIPLFADFSGGSDQPFDPPLIPLALASGVLGAFLGVMFGLVQRLALRTAATNSRFWVYANAVGWGLALPIIYIAASTGDPAAPTTVLVATGVGAGLLAGIVLGGVTGLAFWKMEPRQ